MYAQNYMTILHFDYLWNPGIFIETTIDAISPIIESIAYINVLLPKDSIVKLTSGNNIYTARKSICSYNKLIYLMRKIAQQLT